MTQRAADLRLDVSDQDVDRILADVQAESHVESDAAFDELLQTEGMSRAKRRAATHRQLLISQVRELASGKLTVSHDDALKYFAAHRRDLSTPAGVTFREIQIAVPRPGAVPLEALRRGAVMLSEKQRVAVEALLTRLRFSAILEWKRRDLQAAYERPPYR